MVVAVLAILTAACSVDVDSSSSPSSSSSESPPTPSTSGGTDSNEGGTTSDGPDGSDDPDDESADDGARSDGADGSQPRGPTEGDLTRDEALELIAEMPGQLAIGNGPTLAVARPDGLTFTELDGGPTREAAQPTWSHDGLSLIWSATTARSHEVVVQSFDDEGLPDGADVTSDVPGKPIFYFQWNDDDDTVAYLRESDRRGIEGGVLEPGGLARRLLDAQPFYLAWAPSGTSLAAHLDDQRLVALDAADAVPLEATPDSDQPDPGSPSAGRSATGDQIAPGGGYSSPAWIDDDTLLAVVEGALSRVEVATGATEPLLDVAGPVRFVLSPDRTRAAVQVAGRALEEGPLEVGLSLGSQADQEEGEGDDATALVLLDVEDGGATVVTQDPALVWEWSPDGAKLAWLELSGPAAQRSARWRFWSADGSPPGDATSPNVRLSFKELVRYFPFFAQYTHSISRWSPDSSAFAIAGSIGSTSGIWIHTVDRAGPPILVAPGDFVAWGPGPTPAPAGGRSPA